MRRSSLFLLSAAVALSFSAADLMAQPAQIHPNASGNAADTTTRGIEQNQELNRDMYRNTDRTSPRGIGSSQRTEWNSLSASQQEMVRMRATTQGTSPERYWNSMSDEERGRFLREYR